MAHSPKQSDLVAPVSLLDQLQAIEDGRLSKTDSVAACLERIKLHDDKISAYTALNSIALDEAEKASGPLAGLGLAVKDIIETFDLPTEHNSPIYSGAQPRRDAAIVAMARAAGCAMIGKSVTTEFAFFHPGPTRNPHNLQHTPGGSSSGSAAAIASGMAHLAIGTQTGGSMIRPAAFCGVTGYKPSAGLLPKVGVKDFSWSLDTVGLFAAKVADVAYASSVLTNRDLKVAPDAAFHLPKIGVVRSHLWQEADPAYRKLFDELVEGLKQLGVEVKDIAASDHYIAAFHAHQVIQDYEARQALAWENTNHPELLSPLLKQTLDFAQTIKAMDYDDARVCAETASAEIDEHFEDIDAFITLSAPGPAPIGLDSTGSSIFNRIWTLFDLPCMNVTGLENDAGLPLGIQIVGPYMADRATLQIAHWLEGAIQRLADR